MEWESGEINPALNDMIKRGQLSEAKLAGLVHLKKTVDRFAGRNYTSAEEVAALKEKYGEAPDIITWGDYFQTEIGSRHFQLSDEEFRQIVDTARFDLISAVMIFAGKPDSFFEMVQAEGNASYELAREEWGPQQEEAAHLFVLRNYFLELGLETCILSDEDQTWFQGFLQDTSLAAG